jgi:F0F1-type ATP synthase assembly protein I
MAMQIEPKKRIIIIQTSLTLFVILVLYFIDITMAKSAFLGGFIAIITTTYTLIKVFKKYDATQPHLLLANFYAAEMGRLILVFTLFAFVFALLKPINVIVLFVVFIINHLLPVFLAPYNMR